MSPHAPRSRRLRALSLSTCSVLAVTTLSGTATTADATDHHGGKTFQRTATYPVFQNLPAGADPTQETVAEISAVSKDGRTLIYSDAPGKRIGFVDITNPSQPQGRGVVDLHTLGNKDDQPTSVTVVGDYVLVVVDTSSSFTAPSGRLDVIRIKDRQRVRSIDLGGQPDSIAVSRDERYAAIAIENQRDEEFTPDGAEEGDLPQLPAGFVQVLDLPTSDPSSWTTTPVRLNGPDGAPIAAVASAGLDTPADPEPEYVAINSKGQLVVTLQENNGLVTIDLASKKVLRAFSAGAPTITGVDTEDDGRFDTSGTSAVPREPDAVAWVDDRYVATANEGDWKGGGRGWTIFDTHTGQPVWDAGRSFEDLATQHGLHNEDRAGKKGAEPEGISVATFNGRRYAFVASERSNFVAVYDLVDPRRPRFTQILPTAAGPEGLLPIPERGLLAVSSEVDDASVGLRASVGLYKIGGGNPTFPTIASTTGVNGPVGWSALSGLSGLPGRPGQLVGVSDSAYATGRIYSIDARRTPARITSATDVNDANGPVALDVEGIAARPDGGYWLAAEGAEGSANSVVRVDNSGRIQQTVKLPEGVTQHIGKWGLEGVTTTGRGSSEVLYVALQRPLWTDPKKATGPIDGEGVARIGRYDVATGVWSWFGYQLSPTRATGDWMGLSEITAVDGDTLAVIERDKLSGPAARVKRVVTVDLPQRAAGEELPMVRKRATLDLLPRLRATNGWTQEKLEGFTIDAAGKAYAVTDNDGVQDATGETVFLPLGHWRR